MSIVDPSRSTAPATPPSDPPARWAALGIITAEQADAIRADLATAPAPLGPPGPVTGGQRHGSLVAEALGYLGGAVILVALGLIAGRFWPDLPDAARLTLAAGSAAALVGAGLAVPPATPTGDRLRSVLWLLAAALTAGFLSLFANLVLGWHARPMLLTAGTGTAVAAAALWWRHHRLLQQFALVAALVTAVATATSLIPGSADALPAAGVWVLGIGWALLGGSGVLTPPREVRTVGAAVAAASTAFFAAETWGSVPAVLTLVVLAVVAVRLGDPVLLGIAAVATLLVLPAVVTTYVHGLLAAAAVLLVVGGLLILAAVLTVRRRPASDGA